MHGLGSKLLPYSGKLSREKTFAKNTILAEKISWIDHFCRSKGASPPILQRKLSRIATKTQNLQKFSPLKVSRETTTYIPTLYESQGIVV